MEPRSTIVSVLPFLIFLPLLYWRTRRLARPQPLKLGQMWIRPALILALCAVALFVPQPGQPLRVLTPVGWFWMILAGALGALAGWQAGRTMAIEVHPENGTLMTRGGWAAMAVIAVLVAVRMGLRTGLALEGRAWHLDVLLISDAAIVFSATLFVVRSLEMALRARRVMERARRLP